MLIGLVIKWCRFVLEPFVKTDLCYGAMESDDIKQEVTPLSMTSSSTSPKSTSFYMPYQSERLDSCQFSVESCPAVRHTGPDNSSSFCCSADNKLSHSDHVRPCPSQMFGPDLITSSQNCPFTNDWSNYSRLPPPQPPFNMFCLPFYPGYCNPLPPVMTVLPQSEHHESLLPMQALLARYAMVSAAHMQPLLRGLFPWNPSALFPPTNPHAQLSGKLPDLGVPRPSVDAGDVTARPEVRRLSCDSTATSGGGDGTMMSMSDSTSSPRVVSSTSDDLEYDDAPAHFSDVARKSLLLVFVCA